MFVLVEGMNLQNEGLCLKTSVEANIVLHMNIKESDSWAQDCVEIPQLASIALLSSICTGALNWQGMVLVLKPYASDCRNTNSEDTEDIGA